MVIERNFARTMADRNQEGFAAYISDEAVFFEGETALRGKQRILEAWAPYFVGPDAPFSWEPDTVEVLESGTLALSSGPVLDSTGQLVARFTSIWRREATGAWRIIFDRGNETCD